MMKKIYLDANIFVVYHSTADSNKEQKKQLNQALEILKQLKDVELWTSMWSITEMVKVLVKSKDFEMDAVAVSEIEGDLVNESRIGGIKIHIADVSPSKSYDFKEFFYNIRKLILKNDSGVPDAIHSIIVVNNNFDTILTFDAKGFKQVVGATVLNPKDLKAV